jgi:DNA repair protein RadD
MAALCRDSVLRWNGRVIILAHVKELLEQNSRHLFEADPELALKVGIYSAGLKCRDTEHPVIVAGIQSVYKRACELDAFDLIIVDEAHMIPDDGEGMYRQFLSDMKSINPNVRIIGLTATPFRMKSGMICAPGNILNHVCYEVGVRELIVQGFLCPLKTKSGTAKADTSGLHVRAGEFVAEEVENLMDTEHLVESACVEIVELTRERKSVLVFAAGIAHANHVAEVLRGKYGADVATVFGDTPYEERDSVIKRFKAGGLKFLVNVNVLTTGFDAPNVDCIVLLRPTMSPGLYYQMVGRGFRLFPGKENCLVLDYGGNVLRHGPVDAIKIKEPGSNGGGEAPAKECPQCHALVHAAYSLCPECGYEFPPPEKNTSHDSKASSESILSGEVSINEYPVQEVFYSVHEKRDAPPDAPLTMRVDYQVGWQQYHSEWICFEHDGYARRKAEVWWKQRCKLRVPDNIEDAVYFAQAGALAKTKSITVRSVSGEKFSRITGYDLGEKPDYREPGWDEEEIQTESSELFNDETIPF